MRCDRLIPIVIVEDDPPIRRGNEMSSRLVRPRRGRWIGGVCAGLARRFNMPPNLVRLLFVLSCLLPGPQFILYIAMWILIPSED